MDIIERLREWAPEISEWRQDIHAHPETAFEDVRTSDLVADKLGSFDIEVHRGLANTGVVGVLTAGDGPLLGGDPRFQGDSGVFLPAGRGKRGRLFTA